MLWSDLFSAVALLLIIEGLLPTVNPEGWKRAVMTIAQMDNSQLRRVGLISMIVGAVLLYFIRL